jgi:PIN domain nuclease of toxin-antitoxin system
LASGDARLSGEARSRIQGAAAVFVSAITGYEIGIKVRRSKLSLPLPPAEWFDAVVAHHGLTELPLDLSTCVMAANPPPHHGDPSDRMIIAAALKFDVPVVTADEAFEEYDVAVVS